MRFLFREVCLFWALHPSKTPSSQPPPCLLSILRMVSSNFPSSLKRQQDAAPALSMLVGNIKVTCQYAGVGLLKGLISSFFFCQQASLLLNAVLDLLKNLLHLIFLVNNFVMPCFSFRPLIKLNFYTPSDSSFESGSL